MELGEDGIIVYTPIVGEFARAYGALTRIIATAQRDAMIEAGWRHVPEEGGPKNPYPASVYLPVSHLKYSDGIEAMRRWLLAQEVK